MPIVAATAAKRAAVAAALSGVLSTSCLPSAGASTAAAAAGTGSAATGSWGVVATQSALSPPAAEALTLTALTATPLYYKAVNVVTVTLRSMSWSVVVSGSGATLKLSTCSVAWVQGGSGTCSGVTTTVGTWVASSSPGGGQVTSGTTVTSGAVPTASTTTLYLRATPGSLPKTGAKFTVNTSVSSGGSSQLRQATVTDS